MKWDNFFSRADLVSGRLQAFPGWPTPANHPARGLGGLISSHVGYNRNPAFLGLLSAGLTGTPRQLRLSRLRRIGFGLMATLESLMLPATFAALAIGGLAITVGLGWTVGWVVSRPLEWLDLGGWARGVQIYFAAAMLFVMTIVAVMVGRGRAKALHARYWANTRSG